MSHEAGMVGDHGLAPLLTAPYRKSRILRLVEALTPPQNTGLLLLAYLLQRPVVFAFKAAGRP